MMLLLPNDSSTAVLFWMNLFGWRPGLGFRGKTAAPVSDGQSDSECQFKKKIWCMCLKKKKKEHTYVVFVHVWYVKHICVSCYPFAYIISMMQDDTVIY